MGKYILIIIIILIGLIAYHWIAEIKSEIQEPIKIDAGIFSEKPVESIKLTTKELKLKDKIVKHKKDKLTLDEWQYAGKLLEKMIKKSKISYGEFLDNYYKKSYHKIIRELDKKIKVE